MEPQRPDAKAWFTLAVLAVINCLSYTDRWVISVLLQPIKMDLGLSDSQLGVLTGFGFSIAYAVFALPLARWADRGTRRTVLIVAVTLWSAATALTGLAQTFWQLLLARVGVGAGEAGCIPTCQSLISDYFPKHARAFALAIFTAGAMAGKVVGIGGGGLLAQQYGWQTTLFVLAIPGLLVAMLVRFVVEEPQRGRFDHSSGVELPPIPLREALRTLLSRKSFVLLVLGLATSNVVLQAVQTWTPSFYMRQYGLTASEVGASVAGVVGLGSAVGVFAGGYLMQHLMKNDARWATRAAGAVHLVLVAIAMAIYLTDTAATSIALFAAASILINVPAGAVFAAQLNVAPPRARALATAIILALTSILGLGVGPLVVGVMSDFLASTYQSQSLRYALAAVTVLYLLPALLYFAASSTLREDISAAEGVTSR